MKKFIAFNLIAFFTGISFLKAQTATDVFRASYNNPAATARTMGISNAIGSLGGDFSALSINPAGIATYRVSDFNISMGYFGNSATAGLRGANNTTTSETDNKFTFNNIGLVFANSGVNEDWKTSNFGIGFNRLADFNRTIYYTGSSPGSLVTLFRNDAQAGIFDNFGNNLAYDAGALFDTTVNGSKIVYSDFNKNPTGAINKIQTLKQSGGIGEMVISYGANYKEKLSLGATLGVDFLNYARNSYYTENNGLGTVDYFDNLTYNDYVTTTGTGLNLKLGAIYKLTPDFRIGLAVHTPTIYWLNEAHNSDFTYNYTVKGVAGNPQNTAYSSPDGTSDYKVFTPWKGIVSASYVVGKLGFISADLEMVNYSSATVSFATPDSIGQSRKADIKTYETSVNSDVQATYKTAYNLNVGAEGVIDILRLRAGISVRSSPLLNDNTTRTNYSLGIGLRGQHTYFDVAYRSESTNFVFQPYTAGEVARQPNVDIKTTSAYVMATLGFKF